jgi:hypothetical protein
MRDVAAVTSFFDDVATLAEWGADFLRNAQVFSLNSHSLKRDGMAALPELLQLLGMAFPALIGENHGFRPISGLVIGMTGDAVHSILGMLGFHPGLEEAGGSFYMAAHTVSGLDPISRFPGGRTCAGDQ